MAVNHNTRSINALLMGPSTHNVTSNTTQWGPPANLIESFSPAGYWIGTGPNPTFFGYQASHYEIANSSLKRRHGQARILSWTTYASTGTDRYTYNPGAFYDSYGVLNYGQPTYIYSNAFGALAGTPQLPCPMSKFSRDGKHNNTGLHWTGTWGYSDGAITMAEGAANTDPSPISMGPTAGI